MDRSFRSGLILLAGIALLATALAIQVILLETVVWTVVLAGAGVLLSAWGAFALRTELGEVVQRRLELSYHSLRRRLATRLRNIPPRGCLLSRHEPNRWKAINWN